MNVEINRLYLMVETSQLGLN